MAKKKLLNEATVRRFMGLAGMESKFVSNKLTEMYDMKKEEKHMEEDLYEEEDMEDMEDEEDMEDDADLSLDQDKAQQIVDAYDTLGELVNDIKASMGDEGAMDDMEGEEDLGGEPEDLGGDEDLGGEPEDLGDEDLGDEEMLEGVELQLSEDEIVQEVAKRVATRILRAKRAKKQLDEALGRTKKR
jgi:hypothetical protein